MESSKNQGDGKGHSTHEEFQKTEHVQLDGSMPRDTVVARFPEGGLAAWMTVLGGFLCFFVTGVEYSFGVFLLYYSETFLSNHTLSQIGWIGSTAGFVHTTIGLVVGKLYDDGWVRYLIFAGSILHVFCFYMLSLCRNYWQVFLTQGLGFGIATGLLYQPALAIASQYFERRRAFATGIVMGGGSFGGIIFPIMVNNLIDKLGFEKAVIICASFMLGCLLIANITLRPRIRYRNNRAIIGNDLELTESNIQDRELVEKYEIKYKTFFNFPYAMAVLGCFFVYLGITFPTQYITIYATTHGEISASLQTYLLPITFAASVVGTPLWAWIADRTGVFNIMIISVAISSALLVSILGATNDATSLTISLLFGFWSAGFNAVLGTVFASLSSSVLELGHRQGIAFFLMGIATLISLPSQGSLVGKPHHYVWWKVIFFVTFVVALGVVCLTVSRASLLKRRGVSKKVFGIAVI